MSKCVISETAEPIETVDHSLESPCKGAGLKMKDVSNPLADALQGPRIVFCMEVLRSQCLAGSLTNFDL